MKQLVLDILTPPAAELGNFVVGQNSEAVAAVQSSLSGSGEPMLYLWGEPGCGRSHLLQAASRVAQARGLRTAYVDCGQLFAPDETLLDYDCVALDNVEHLDAEAQVAVFALYNQFRDLRRPLLASGPCLPAQLPLRADLTTRFGWGLVFRLQPLSDDEKTAALQIHAAERGFNLSNEACRYLLQHARRDLPSLLAIVAELDHTSLEKQKPVTLPLLRQVLQNLTQE